MNFLHSDDVIIACSSGSNVNTAVSLIRISGFEDPSVFDSFFSMSMKSLKPRYAHYTNIVKDNEVIDSIVLTYFKGPNSYNGENILELGVHGNLLNIERIIKYFVEKAALRYADPGEFTYRALRNNKMTLSQVEGLDLFLNTTSNYGLKQGLSLLGGQLQHDYSDLFQHFLNHKSAVELSIDFLDDVGEEEANIQFNKTLKELNKSITTLYNRIIIDGVDLVNPEIVIVGQPNSGKSTLFNRLLNNKRAITSAIAGTTRDYLTEKIKIGDTYFTLVDTAGIRKTQDEIEEEGIRISFEKLQTAFYKILLINPFEFNVEEFEGFDLSVFDSILFTHNDLEGFTKAKDAILEKIGPIEPIQNSGPMGADLKSGPIEPNQSSGPMGADLKSGPIEPIQNSGPMGADLKSGPIEPIISIRNYNLLSDEVGDLKELVQSKYNIFISSNP
jgi:tRNA modification GTPase